MDTSIKIPNNFPSGCSKIELDNFISVLSNETQELGLESKPSIPRQAHRAYVGSLIQLAQSEKRDRISTRLFWLSTFVSFVSAIVACSALYVSYLSLNSSTTWEDRQLEKIDVLVSSINNAGATLKNSNKMAINKQTEILISEMGSISSTIETVNKQFKRDAASVAP